MSRAKSPGRTIYLSLEHISFLRQALASFEDALSISAGSEDIDPYDKRTLEELRDTLNI